MLAHRRAVRARRFPVARVAFLAKLWNAPNTLVGLALGAVGLPFGGSARLGHNAIQFLNHPLLLPRYAMTLGNVVLYGRSAQPSDLTRTGVTLAEHERQHTLQGEQLGPLYLFSNVIGGLLAVARDGRWHGPTNWNERGPLSVPARRWAWNGSLEPERQRGVQRGSTVDTAC